MNRRNFLIAAITVSVVPWRALAAAPSLLPRNPLRDKGDILTPEEISRHFVYVPTPVSMVDGHMVVVKSYFTGRSVAYEDEFNSDGSISEKRRREMASEHIDYIKKWFGFYKHVWRGRAIVYGPYVHSVRLISSPLVDHRDRKFHSVIMRVGKVVVDVINV